MEYEKSAKFVFLVMRICIFSFASVFNTLSYVVLSKCYKNVANLLLKVYLTTTTFAIGLLTLYYTINYLITEKCIAITGYWGNLFRNSTISVWYIFLFVSIWSIVLLAVHRCTAIKYPVLNQKIWGEKWKVRTYLCFVFILAVVSMLPRIIHNQTVVSRTMYDEEDCQSIYSQCSGLNCSTTAPIENKCNFSADSHRICNKFHTKLGKLEVFGIFPIFYNFLPIIILWICINIMIKELCNSPTGSKNKTAYTDILAIENAEVTKIILCIVVMFGNSFVLSMIIRTFFFLPDIHCQICRSTYENIIQQPLSLFRDICGSSTFLIFFAIRKRFRKMFFELFVK